MLLLLLLCIASGSLRFRHHEDGYFGLRQNLNEALKHATQVPEVTTKYIEQPLDHFDDNEKRTWKMRYFESLDYFAPGGPIIIHIGGEGPSFPGFLQEGFMPDFAAETNGAMFHSEHRYYGESIPLDVTVLDNLKYLDSSQALADLAVLVRHLKSGAAFASSRVVVVGGSYAGNLAAWFRLRYPALADAALASSAPVGAKVDFYEYFETVGEDYYKYGGARCYRAITEMIQGYEEYLKTPEGRNRIRAAWNVCDGTDLSKPETQYALMESVTSDFIGNAKSGGKNAIVNHCKQILDIPAGKNHSETQLNCHSFMFPGDFRDQIRQTRWWYQTCTEFGYFQTTTSDKQPFLKSLPLKFSFESCSVLYGVDEARVRAGVARTSELYGGVRPNVTRVVFTNGGCDPWHRLGVLQDLSPDAPARLIPDAIHCQDLYSPSIFDSRKLIETRKFVKATLKNWIGL